MRRKEKQFLSRTCASSRAFRFLSHLAFFFIVAGAGVSCSLRLHQPEGRPAYPPEGLWLYQDDNNLDVLRIVCKDRCWFRNVFLNYRELPLSGPVVHQTVRSGYLQTSATEILLVQTEFRTERIEWKSAADPVVHLDRLLHGETRFRLLRWKSADELEDGEVFQRQCHTDCSSPLATIALIPRYNKKILVSPDAAALSQGILLWPADLQPPYRSGVFSFVETDRTGPFTVAVKERVDLGLAYESLISLTPGAQALDLSRRRRDAEELEKKKRREDVRRRLKAGEPVSKEEMLDVLE
jgi:hypothetical protein